MTGRPIAYDQAIVSELVDGVGVLPQRGLLSPMSCSRMRAMVTPAGRSRATPSLRKSKPDQVMSRIAITVWSRSQSGWRASVNASD
jgi:hypothetical protein